MSDLDPTHEKWREAGSLRYLAEKLNVSTKQVTRYWDAGCVPGRYRTPKGHRRIRYSDDTVERVALQVNHAKKANTAIRYHAESIDFCGTIIPVKGCTRMEHVHKRARAAGLDDCDARNAVASVDTSSPDEDLTWELHWATKRTSIEEAGESIRFFSQLGCHYLCKAIDAKDFRSRARSRWQTLVSAHKRKLGLDKFSSLSPENKAELLKSLKPLRDLLLEPTLESFMQAWGEATELQRPLSKRFYKRDSDGKLRIDGKKLLIFKQHWEKQPKARQLKIAALSLNRSSKDPSASALARAIGISRPALYRTFDLKDIQEALRALQNDTQAIHETSDHMLAKRKKRTICQSSVEEGVTRRVPKRSPRR